MELVINNLDTKKSTGYDRISPKLVVKCKDAILPILQGPTNTFLLENALKKTTEYFPKFLLLFESTILAVNNGK